MMDPETTVEVVHEALFEQWDELRSWLDSSRDDLRFRRRLNEAAEEFSRGQGDELLWWGARFEQLEGYCQRHQLTAAQRIFYDSCVDYQARRENLARWNRELLERALRSQSLFLTSLSRQETEKGDAETGMILALEAVSQNMAASERRP
jgi:hypothetical protein